jgi:hypothetical protein
MEALTLLGKLQAKDEERKTNKETSVENTQRDFLKRENKELGNAKEENRREYHQDVKHITYDRREIKYPKSPYNQNPYRRYQHRNYGGRTGVFHRIGGRLSHKYQNLALQLGLLDRTQIQKHQTHQATSYKFWKTTV